MLSKQCSWSQTREDLLVIAVMWQSRQHETSGFTQLHGTAPQGALSAQQCASYVCQWAQAEGFSLGAETLWFSWWKKGHSGGISSFLLLEVQQTPCDWEVTSMRKSSGEKQNPKQTNKKQWQKKTSPRTAWISETLPQPLMTKEDKLKTQR